MNYTCNNACLLQVGAHLPHNVSPKTMHSLGDFNRIYWHSRRGMLELDLILMPFMEKHFRDLTDTDKTLYVRLLECEDQDMFGWFLQQKKSDDPELCRMVELILDKHKQ